MIVYDLKEFARLMRGRLQASPTREEARKVAIEIKCAKHLDGTFLTIPEEDKIVYYVKYDPGDDGSGRIKLQESDNSEFLKLVAIVANIIKGNK